MANQYKNELAVTFAGKVDASFKKAVNDVSSSLKGLAGSGGGGGAISNVDKQSKSAAKSMGIFSGATNSVVSAFKTLARFAAAGAIFGGITKAITSSVSAVVEYDQALKNLQAITNSSNFEVEAFGRKMIEVSNNTKFSANEVAQAMVYLGQSGFAAREALESIDAIASVATGTLTDFALTADLFTSAIRAFQLETAESARVADIFASAVNKSKLTIQGMRTIFNYVGASAAQAGVQLEEVAAAAGLLANNGMRFSTVGTSMRNVISRMIAPSKKMRTELAYAGLTIDQINPRIVGFQKAMQNLSKILVDQKTGLADAGKAYELFGLRGQQAANVFVRTFTSGEYEQMLDNITGVGEAFRQQLKQQEGLGVKLKNLGDRFKNLGVAIGELGLKGIIEGLIDSLSSFVLWLSKSVTSLTKFINIAKAAKGDVEARTSLVLAEAEAYREGSAALEKYIQVLANIQKSGEKSFDTQKEINRVLELLRENYPELIGKVNVYGRDLEKLIPILQKYNEELNQSDPKAITKAMATNRADIKETEKEVSKLTKRYKELTSGLSLARADSAKSYLQKELAETSKQLTIATDRLKNLTYEQNTYIASLAKTGEGITDSWDIIAKANAKAIEESENAFKAWRDLLDDLGPHWQAAWKKVTKTGSVTLQEDFIQAAKDAAAAAEETITALSETRLLSADDKSSIRSTKFNEALAKFWKEQNKDAEREREKAQRRAKELFQKNINAEKATLDKSLANVRQTEAEKEKALTASNATKLQRLRAQEDIDNAEFEARKKSAKKMLDLAIESAKERGDETKVVEAKYRADLNALIVENDTKAIERERAIFEERMANPEDFADAWESAMRSIEKSTKSSFSKVRDWIVNSVDEFADSSADAFLDFVEGTKNAGEAFSEMAYSILRDLTKMIIKQQILNAVMSGMEAMSGMGGFLGSVGSFFAGAMGSNHSGGMAGKASSIKKQLDPSAFINAPRFHNGGEVPAVLEKGEVVQTREQAAQSREPRNVRVVIENKTGTQVGNATATSSINMGEEIIRIVLDGIDRNRSGLRTKVASVR